MNIFLKLVHVDGISIEVHWTFVLMIIWIGFLEFQKK